MRRIAVRVVVATLVILGLAALILHTGWAKEKLRARAEAALARRVIGTVSVGSLDYGFLLSDVRLHDIEIRDPDGAPVIELASLKLDLDRWASLRGRLTIDRLRARQIQIAVHVDAEGKNNLRRLFRPRKGGSAAWTLRAIEVDSLGLVITNARANKIALSDLMLRASVSRDEVTNLVLDELETDVFVQLGERQAIAGHLSQRGASLRVQGEQLELKLTPLRTQLELRRDGFPTQKTEILLGQSSLALSPGRIVADLADAVLGPLRVGHASLDLSTQQGLLEGPQRAFLASISVDTAKLGALLGRNLQVGRASGDLRIEGQADALVLSGSFATPEGQLQIAGRLDATGPNAPVFDIKTTTNIQLDKIGALPRGAEAISSLLPTLFRLNVKGTGFPQLDGRAELSLEALTHETGRPPTKLLDLKAHMANQSVEIDSLKLSILGTELEADGKMDTGSFGVGAQLTLRGNARQALARLEALGLHMPRSLRLPAQLDLSMALRGNFDDHIVVTLAPSETAIAGGTVLVVGQAEFAAAPEGMQLVSARGTMTMRRLQLARIAGLAGRAAAIDGILSGTFELEQEGASRRIEHSLRIDMSAQSLSLDVRGAIVDNRWTGRARATDMGGGPALAWLEGSLSLQDDFKLRRRGPIDLRASVPTTTLARHLHRLPLAVQSRLSRLFQDLQGELQITVGGSLHRPVGHMELAAAGRVEALPAVPLELRINAEITSDEQGRVQLRPGGELIASGQPWLVVGGGLRFEANRRLSFGERLKLQLEFDVPRRSLAELAPWSMRYGDEIRRLPGELQAHLRVDNTLADPRLGLSAKVANIANLAGSTSDFGLQASADRNGGSLELRYGAGEPLLVKIAAQKLGAMLRVQVDTEARSIRVSELIPSFLAQRVPTLVPLSLGDAAMLVSDLGMGADIELKGGQPRVLALELKGATRVGIERLALPQSSRSYRNLKLEVEGKADTLSLSVAVEESDTQEPLRRLDIDATLSLRELTGLGSPALEARIRAEHWLLFGGKLGNVDAPRATIDADLSASAQLSGPLPVIDLRVNSLSYSEPEREVFTHGFEHFSPGGDVVFSDDTNIALGKLGPRKALEEALVPPWRALLRLHVPTAIEIAKGPLRLAVKAEVELPIGYGDGPSGQVEVVSGTIVLFRQPFAYTSGDISLGRHPTANLYFTGKMPPDVARKLSRESAGNEVLVHLRPIGGGPVISFLGAGNEDMIEALSLLHTGQPFIRAAPDAAASSTVRAPQLTQPITIAFVKANIPRLDLFDRFGAWSDAYDSSTSYGQLRYLDAEKRLGDGVTRLRLVARPEQIGRSTGEAHIERLFVDSRSLSLGVSASAGSRLGGGVGLFFEWSSDD